MIQSSTSSEMIHQDADLSLRCLFSELPTEIKNKMAEYLDLKDLCAFIQVNKQIKSDLDHFGCFKRFLEEEFQFSQPEEITKEMFTFEVRRRNGIKLDHSSEFYETQLSRWFIDDLYGLLGKKELRFFTVSELNELKSLECLSDITRLLTDGHLTIDELRRLCSVPIQHSCYRHCIANLIKGKHITVRQLQEFSREDRFRIVYCEMVELILSNHIEVRHMLALTKKEFARLAYPGIRAFIQSGYLRVDEILSLSNSDYDDLKRLQKWDLVHGGHITVEQMLQLSCDAHDRLKIFRNLILDGYITADEVLKLSDEDVQKFRNPEVVSAIGLGFLSIEKVCSGELSW